MITLNGLGVFKDISFGKVLLLSSDSSAIKKCAIKNTDLECDRYNHARQDALKKTHQLYEKTLRNLGQSEADVFAAHEMMINDNSYSSSVKDIIISEHCNAEFAVWETCKKFSDMFLSMDNEYMKNRASDVADISKSIICCLAKKETAKELLSEDVIIVAKDLTPGEISSFDQNHIKGFALAKGSVCSHASILSKVMKIPGIVGLGDKIKDICDGDCAIIDGFSGTLYINPDTQTKDNLLCKKQSYSKNAGILQMLKGAPNITLDGRKIDIFANINNPEELQSALENDCGGIGLFRSEFLYLNKNSYPTENEQFAVYRHMAESLGNKELVIRTLDIGSDKREDYMHLPQEENPALGYRGIRVSLGRPEIFKTQLRAIYRASAFGKISIMFPMITSIGEVKQAKAHAKAVQDDLKSHGILFDKNLKLGIMIETPAAVMISDELAKEADFFSIGTNDLTQYTLAVDRQNPEVSEMFDSAHRAVLKMIKTVCSNAKNQGITVEICGEAACDEKLTEFFISLGVQKLSMLPSSILSIRKKIVESDISKFIKNMPKKYKF